jgi:hypothetical protein
VAHHSAERMSSYAVFLPVAIVASLLLGLGDVGNVFTRMVVDLAFLRPGSRKQEVSVASPLDVSSKYPN